MSDKTMTDEDAKWNEGMRGIFRGVGDVNESATCGRILATYHALAASQQDVERLRLALLSRAVDTLPLGSTIIKTEKLDALRASLAVAQSDTARLDWLEAQSDGSGWIARQSTQGRGFRTGFTLMAPANVRDAIDAAMSAARPPETTETTPTHGETLDGNA